VAAVGVSLANNVIRQLVVFDEHGTILGSRRYETANTADPRASLLGSG
jgi:hypothetical protein